MTLPRKIGLGLIATAMLATAGHHLGWELPSLRWFYSFTADPEAIRENPVRARQASWIGWAISGAAVLIGLLMVVKGGSFRWNPLTERKMARFRSIGRGQASLVLLGLCVVLALLDQALVGKRALAVRQDGRWVFPAFVSERFSERDFGGDGEQEVDYRQLKQRLESRKGGGKVILPPIPWDPVFDTDETLRRPLPVINGVIFDHAGRAPFSGYAVRYQSSDEARKSWAGRLREGRPSGPAEVYNVAGELAGREQWREGVRVENSLPEEFEAPDSGPWIEEVYPPLPPTWERRHFLGTDSKGWDLAAQLFGGMQVVFKAAVLFLVVTYGLGIALGCTMGYYGGVFDLVVQRAMEILSNVPFLLVVMIITNNLGLENITLTVVILIFGAFSWIGVATYLRTETYKEKARDYAQAARVLGAGTGRVIFRHILPNTIATIVTLLPFSVASVIASLTALDFLGFGVPDRYPSWGRILNDGVGHLSSPWIVSSVFVMMVLLLLLITFIGEAVREAFDPKKFTVYR